MAMVSEILRFILPRSPAGSQAFAELRRRVASHGLARVQYFGYVLPNEGAPVPKPNNQLCWYIEWPKTAAYRSSGEFQADLAKVAQSVPRSLLFELIEREQGEVVRGLEAPVCEMAIINTRADTPRLEAEFEGHMDKTYTDCDFAPGFTGGGWGYALNTNDADGIEATDGDEPQLPEKDRRLAYYVIGWDSLADHHAYAKTELFFVEINHLAPYFGPGTGAFYVNFEKHQ